MIGVTADLPSRELSELLDSDDRGVRLAAFSGIYSRPDPDLAQQLTAVVCEEDKPFGQYWGLRALRRVVDADPGALDRNSRRRLEELLRKVPSGTDRAYELREILSADK
jgi:hypothetical protein